MSGAAEFIDSVVVQISHGQIQISSIIPGHDLQSQQ